MSPTVEDVLDALRGQGLKVRQQGGGWRAQCPAHEGTKLSLSIAEGDRVGCVLKCHSHPCTFEEIIAALGLTAHSSAQPPVSGPIIGSVRGASAKPPQALDAAYGYLGAPDASWSYHDADGKEVGRTLRWNKPDGTKEIRPANLIDGQWCLEAMPSPRPMYNLPEVLKADTVHVCEGEKAADAARSCGFVGTTSAGGSKAASKTDWSPCKDRHVVILPDNDEPGERYAETVAKAVLAAGARSVRIVRLVERWTGLCAKGDMVEALELCEGNTEAARAGINSLAEGAHTVQEEGCVGSVSTGPGGFEVLTALPCALPPVKTLDPEMLPEKLRGFITDIAERVQCPMEFVAGAAIICAAGVLGRKVGIRPQCLGDWLVVPNLWGMVVGRPGVMKSPAVREAMRFLRELERKAKESYRQQEKERTANAIVSEERRKQAKKDARESLKNGGGDERATKIILKSLSEEAVPETRRRYLVNDTTVEKLGELLAENPNGLTAFRDELIGLLKGLDKEGQEGARAFFLEAWNGDGSITYDRIIRGTVDVDSTTLSLLGCIQPGPLAAYVHQAATSGSGDDGLIQRFQIAFFPDNSKDWVNVDRAPNKSARNDADEVYEHLDQLTSKSVRAFKGEDIPFLRFTAEAQRGFDSWRKAFELELRSCDERPIMESHLAKYRSLIPSLALLFHLIDGCIGPVGIESLQRALAWADVLESHARRIYAAAENTATVPARALAKKIRSGDLKSPFTAREVYRRGGSGLSDRKDVEEAAELLVDHGWLSVETLPKSGPGRRTRAYTVNPEVNECSKSDFKAMLNWGGKENENTPEPHCQNRHNPPEGTQEPGEPPEAQEGQRAPCERDETHFPKDAFATDDHSPAAKEYRRNARAAAGHIVYPEEPDLSGIQQDESEGTMEEPRDGQSRGTA